jgi:phage-related protein
MSIKQKEYIAFEGEEFTIEWYFNNKDKSLALDYFESLNNEEQKKTLQLFKLMGDLGEIRNKTKFNNEGDKIYAFKPQPHRFLCFFFDGKKIILTNAFHKKTDKLPKNEKEMALKIKSDYEERTKKGEYYD